MFEQRRAVLESVSCRSHEIPTLIFVCREEAFLGGREKLSFGSVWRSRGIGLKIGKKGIIFYHYRNDKKGVKSCYGSVHNEKPLLLYSA